MINFLHTFIPQQVVLNIGPISLRWYGVFITLGIIAALFTSFHLGKKYFNIKKDLIIDLAFWLIIFGLLGARIYDVILYLPYYINHPGQIIQIWKGGMAIHGAIIAGLITIYLFSRKNKISFFKISALVTPGLALGQAIGRFGNYFNQELFGRPTNLPWGIPIEINNRPFNFIDNNYFHPTFLYESLGSLIIFLVLIFIIKKIYQKKQATNYQNIMIIAVYMILYSILRFSLEFIRIDDTPLFLNLRWPQIISILLIIISFITLIFYPHAKKNI